MSFCNIYSILPDPIDGGSLIKVEIDISRGFHSFSIVGMGDRAIRESRERISAAIKNSDFPYPKQFNNKITISLAPAELKKEGSIFDLPMAISFLKAKGIIKANIDKDIFVGELALDGEIKKTKGVLIATAKAQELNFERIFIPEENFYEASLVKDITIIPIKTLGQCILLLNNQLDINANNNLEKFNSQNPKHINSTDKISMDQIIGNTIAKRAIEIAITGKHHTAIWGPAGTGKTMLAKAIESISPELSLKEAISNFKIRSFINSNEIFNLSPPFISPHHTSSYSAIIGGGNSFESVGSITLAHKGYLFLDEFLEYDKKVLESLRKPLEEKIINISRVNYKKDLPADFILIASMNPCRCGYYGSKKKSCICSPKSINEYRRKLSEPIADRIPIWIEISEIDYKNIINKNKPSEKTSSEMKEKISISRKFLETNLFEMTKEAKEILLLSSENSMLSARGVLNTENVAKTIASLELSKIIKKEHILEALLYRKKIFN